MTSGSNRSPGGRGRGKTPKGPESLNGFDEKEAFEAFGGYGNDAQQKQQQQKPTQQNKHADKDKFIPPVMQSLPTDDSAYRPPVAGEFRREFSDDHPLLGGAGKYTKEKSKEKDNRPSGTGHFAKPVVQNGLAMTPSQASATIERLSLAAKVSVVDPQRQLETLRREQNEALLRVLEEERAAEESRERLGRTGLSEQERSRLELVFADERRRASDRIVKLTKEHEQRIKDAVLAMMALNKESKILTASEARLAKDSW